MNSNHSNTSSTTLPGESSREDDDHVEATFAPIATHASAINRIRRSLSLARSNSGGADLSRKETRDPDLDIDLPYRTLSAEANLDEYRVEVPGGTIPGPVEPPAVARQSGQKEGERRYKLVTFTPGDPENPKNWSKAYKWWCTMCVALTCFVVAFASSVITADIKGVTEDLHVSEELALASVSLFVVGFGVGPMIFAPLSEIYGRRVIYASTLLIAVIFIIPCAVAKNIETLLVCRAIDGIAFSAPMTLVGGTLADLWRNEERGVPMAAFSAAPFIGPAIGPLVGGFLSDAAGWRWLYWIQLILSGVVWVLITFTVPETYTPTILARRAAKLRKETGEADHVTEQELDMRPLSERLRIFLIRPFQLLFGELIVFLISIYMSVLYGLLYMFFVAFPIIYQKGKGYSAGKTGLMFIPVAVGVILSALCSPFVNKHYITLVNKHNGHPPAEVRLIPMMISCWCIPIGLFIFAWTSYADLSWAGPAMGGFPVGFGFIFLYNAANNYLVDSYQHQAASALAAKTCIRSFWGAAVVLFTEQMYDRLNDQWASTLLAFISLACCAIPFMFWKFGARIRQRSKYAYAGDEDETDDIEKAKGRGVTPGGASPRTDAENDEDLRRARSYVSNP
ncbi:Synaptic vesicle transporter SVOP [Fusarium falciforme]|uniref:Synaptic vesicle transporter SVOP n=1 Tax=Fusarium falciforme TaxID=195108 RepID=A0A9W8R6Y2_9HYPO|nr:MFS domain-containing protein [Fusarium falciforme]KAJ4149262.1 Synaptic vesicle transporter SVOP [Fusarium falciforme]KAJ4187624.1 Synaptic vesicle transporter SVOP [Fusarium falciforme]KAJ4209854.1 Synaptic vesicle transporter SVOP [Fusarium falciforme]KAJ4255932.1 Synaptic vesicle transporter SVOP [Fusarium falciforme]WAO85039.1 MFS domain-containing protein [Fusarium falciforme]